MPVQKSAFEKLKGYYQDVERQVVKGENVVTEVLDVNQKKVTEDQLVDQLYAAGQVNPNTMIIVRADRDVSHGKVVQVMDFAKQAGLHKLAIATDPQKD